MDWLAELGGLGDVTVSAVLLILVLLVVRSIVTGKLVPEAMHDRIVAAKNDQIDTLQGVKVEYSGQIDKLLENDETILRVMRALDPGVPNTPRHDDGGAP